MAARPLTYALVTPAHDEAENLARLAASVVEQSQRPETWVVVDDGSTDGTSAVAAELAARHPWIVPIRGAATPSASQARWRSLAKPAIAFELGLAALRTLPDVVVKLDADVTLPPDFFARLLREFAADPLLGIASGTCHELEDGSWRPRYATGANPRGATRAYRWRCLQELLPLERRVGWDGIDAAKAGARGWRARQIADLPFYHHRPTGARDRGLRAWIATGETLHYLGYRPSFVVARTLYRSRRERAALGALAGYAKAALTREQRCEDAGVRQYVRSRQRLRGLPSRARQALGRDGHAVG